MCAGHYMKAYRYGDPLRRRVYVRQSVSDRLLAHLDISSDGCWLWTGGTNAYGYGVLAVGGKMLLAHRVAAELWLGFRPEPGLCVCHRCDVRRCFRPDHLFIGTHADNNLDMWAKGRGVSPFTQVAR